MATERRSLGLPTPAPCRSSTVTSRLWAQVRLDIGGVVRLEPAAEVRHVLSEYEEECNRQARVSIIVPTHTLPPP